MAKAKTVEERNKELAKEGKKLKFSGFKLCIYPTDKQKEQINKTIGCARFTYNFYLKEKQEVYKETGQSLSLYVFKKSFNAFKQHPLFSWLKEADKFALENAMTDVDKAYTNFFEGRANYPKFKKKHKSRQSYTTNETNQNIKLNIKGQTVQLPKLGEVSFRMDKKLKEKLLTEGLKGRITTATISRHSSGEHYVALKIEEVVSIQTPLRLEDILPEEINGYDLGLTHFLISSTGEKVKNPRYYQSCLKNLAGKQRKLKHMKIGSKNYKKQQQKIAKLHFHIKNMRHDFLHKISRQVVNDSQVIVLEDLNVKGLIRNKKLAKSIQDVGWGFFKQYVLYKAEWEGKTVVFIDKFFPSSKLCHGCKEKNVLLSLNDRVWVCPKCGCEHDRDENAAKNIREEGLRILKEAV